MKFNTLQLKLIAIFLMLIDHAAWVFIPETTAIYTIMRIIGRLAAPIFWFCFVEGYKHTRNRMKYSARLCIASILMGVGNMIINTMCSNNLSLDVSPLNPNIFFTMFLMSIVIQCFEKIKTTKTECGKAATIVAGIILSVIVWCFAEYSIMAWASILCFYFLKYNGWKRIAFVICNLVLCLLFKDYIQLAMIFAVLFLKRYDSEKPRKSLKLLFYLFYPAHLWFLLWLSAVV